VGTGQSFSDSSPSKHTITANGNVTHSDAQSKFSGGSIYFDGTGDYLTVPASSDFDMGAGDFTVDFWFRTAVATRQWFFAASSDYHYSLDFSALSSSKKIGMWASSNGTSWNLIDSDGGGNGIGTKVLSLDTWYHIAMVRNGNNWRTYINGVVDVDVTVAGTITDTSGEDIRIGRHGSATNLDLDGYLDEVRVTKGTALWTSAFTPPTRRNRSAPVVDRSGNDNGGNFATTAMTDVATYRVGEVIRPIDSAVWDFDGTDDYVNLGSGSSLKPTTAITISVWVNPDSSQNTYADIGGGHQNNQGYVIQQDGANANQYYFAYRSTAASWKTSSVTTLTADTWQHFVIVCEFGVTIKHYLNGVETVSDSRSGAVYYDAAEDMFIGHGFSTARCFNGRIGNVQVYNTTLTAQQVKENFNQQRNRFKI